MTAARGRAVSAVRHRTQVVSGSCSATLVSLIAVSPVRVRVSPLEAQPAYQAREVSTIRTDRHDIHDGFLALACCLICWRRLELLGLALGAEKLSG